MSRFHEIREDLSTKKARLVLVSLLVLLLVLGGTLTGLFVSGVIGPRSGSSSQQTTKAPAGGGGGTQGADKTPDDNTPAAASESSTNLGLAIGAPVAVVVGIILLVVAVIGIMRRGGARIADDEKQDLADALKNMQDVISARRDGKPSPFQVEEDQALKMAKSKAEAGKKKKEEKLKDLQRRMEQKEAEEKSLKS